MGMWLLGVPHFLDPMMFWSSHDWNGYFVANHRLIPAPDIIGMETNNVRNHQAKWYFLNQECSILLQKIRSGWSRGAENGSFLDGEWWMTSKPHSITTSRMWWHWYDLMWPIWPIHYLDYAESMCDQVQPWNWTTKHATKLNFSNVGFSMLVSSSFQGGRTSNKFERRPPQVSLLVYVGPSN